MKLTLKYIEDQLAAVKEIKSINKPGQYHLDKDRKVKHWERVLKEFKISEKKKIAKEKQENDNKIE